LVFRRINIGKYYRTNFNIQASQLRVIGPDGAQIGVMSKQEAMDKAKELELDLVEIAPNINPPIARIVDFKKFKYEENKKAQAARKSAGAQLKELWLSPRIADHDLGVRLARADEFLKDGDKVKLTVKFKGREMAHPEVGRQVLDKALAHFGETINIERDTKFEGRNLSVIFAKAKGAAKVEEVQDAKTEN
jgi:translation initiation factor IF-3